MKTIAYEENFGEINFPEGFEEKLKDKTIEEQMSCYRISSSTEFTRTSYGQVNNRRLMERTCPLEQSGDCVALVAKDNCLLVGVLLNTFLGEEKVCLPYEGVCTYCASDNEGTGTKDREDYAYLVCVQ